MVDPSYPNTDQSNLLECDWTDFYEGGVEAILLKVPPSRGKEGDLCIFVDSNYAGIRQAKRYRSVFMIYTNMSLINWYSKKQHTI